MLQSNLNPDIQRSHNLRNTIHTVLLIGGTGLLMGVMAYAVLGTIGLIGATIFGAVGLASLSRVSPKMVLNLYKARPFSDNEMPELQQLMRNLAKKADLTVVPQLHYVPTKMLNAFAVGSRDDSAIAVTDGLLRAMNMRQIAGILAHETSHIVNGDLKVMGLADVLNRITSLLSTIGLIGVPLVFGTGIDIPYIGLALLIFAPTIGGLLQLGLSRAREYDADLDGVTLTGDPEGLASALSLLEQRQRGIWEGMFLPGASLPQPSILRTHPKTEDRIARLQALRPMAMDQIVLHSSSDRPQPSFVPQVHNPRIRWHRFGVYF
ncbi:MAG: M48 family metalloprotease [Phyllobacteriaceae bacterium]|jgi:heat shock protein HtpX|nr:M48 family metalloprotease [Phyllobacteriaceae bacterium]